MERLSSLIPLCTHEPAVILVEKITEAVKKHTGAAAQLDDVTVVAVKRV